MATRYQIKRVLCVSTEEVHSEGIYDALRQTGRIAALSHVPCRNGSDDRKDIDRLLWEIREKAIDAVITYDFVIFAALACAVAGIPYLAWIWDAPDLGLYHEAAKLPTSFLFDFDRIQAEESRSRGCPHVCHHPLGADTAHMEKLVLTSGDEGRFTCDISFIGALYCGAEFRLPSGFSEECRKETETVLADMIGRWDGEDRMSERLSDRTIRQIAGELADQGRILTNIPLPILRKNLEMRFLARPAALRERKEMLERLAGYDLQFYTTKEDLAETIPGVRSLPPLDYLDETPKAYTFSRINLNLTLHSIRSGVPLRVFDILGAGGFLLSSYQPELEEYFTVGKELDVFHTFDEMEDKVAYYLTHEKERQQIAAAGYLRVRETYSREKLLEQMITQVEQEERWEGEIRFV